MKNENLLWIMIVIIILFSLFILRPTINSKMDMDQTVLHLQRHCLNDLYNEQRNIEFCDLFVGINESSDSTLKHYNWSK